MKISLHGSIDHYGVFPSQLANSNNNNKSGALLSALISFTKPLPKLECDQPTGSGSGTRTDSSRPARVPRAKWTGGFGATREWTRVLWPFELAFGLCATHCLPAERLVTIGQAGRLIEIPRSKWMRPARSRASPDSRIEPKMIEARCRSEQSCAGQLERVALS